MTGQNAMMLSRLESSLDKASEQTSTSADRTVNAILAMTETLVSVFQDTNNKTALSRDDEVTTKSDNNEEETFDEAVENDDIIEEDQGNFDEEFRIGYEEYMKSNEKFRVKQDKSDFHAKTHREQNTQSNHGRNKESSIDYIENVQQKQKQNQQQFQINHQSNSNSARPTSDNSPENEPPYKNLFNTATTGTVKFKDINNELSNIILKDDSNLEMGEFYDLFILSISYGYQYDISHLPTAEELTKDIDFKQFFIGGIEHDDAATKRMKPMYSRIGKHFRNRLISADCIPKDTCPLAHAIIMHNKDREGWDILIDLLKGRMVKLGARRTRNLDAERVAIKLLPGETYHCLYEKCNMLSREYISQSQSINLCPRIKLLQKFITELMRSPISIPYLLDFENKLISHLENNDISDYTVPLPFTMKNVYDQLQCRTINSVPHELIDSQPTSTNTMNQVSKYGQQQSTTPILANCETQGNTIDEEDDLLTMTDPEISAFIRNDPVICAFIRNKKKQVCECCMMGPHSAESCYLRGTNFHPTELEQRINLYNKQNGSKLPHGKVPVPWNPRSLNPTHRHSSNSKNANVYKNNPRPFENYSKKNNSKSISFLSTEEPQQQHDMSAMINDQLHIIDTINNEEHENFFQDNVISVLELHAEITPSFTPSIDSDDLIENKIYGDHGHNYKPLRSLPTEVVFDQHIESPTLSTLDTKYPLTNQSSDYDWDDISLTALPDHKNHYIVNDSDQKLPYQSSKYFIDAIDILNERWYNQYGIAPHIDIHLDTASSSITTNDDHSINVLFPSMVSSSQHKQGHVFIANDTYIMVPFASHIDPDLAPIIDPMQQQFTWPSINAIHSSDDPTVFLKRQSKVQPHSVPYNMNMLFGSDVSFNQFTPTKLKKIINQVHQNDYETPRQAYLRQLSISFSTLPPSQFIKIPDLDLHYDGGTNVFAITDRRLFCFYFDVKCDVFQVSGSRFVAKGWGGVLI
jgi:hypothetical protein